MSGGGQARARYIVGPRYDWAFFLLPPTLSLALGIAISGTAFSSTVFAVGGVEETAAGVLIGVVIHAHLVAVFFRSHGNPSVFRLYPARFVVVPLLLWVAITSSEAVAIVATVVATFWDVWHSGAQTFGFARIYDRNEGSPPEVGRRLDYWLNQLLYAGPILAGATMMDHVGALGDLEDVGLVLFSRIPAEAGTHQRYLTYAVLAGGTLFVAYYVLAQLRFRRQGYRVSPLKIFLVASTGLCSVYTWGFNSWGEAFFIMNLFHAVQYLALVWATEHRGMMRRLRMAEGRPGQLVMGGLFLGSVTAYGVAAEIVDPSVEVFWALTMVVSLMHFWYDAFVWSVRKGQI